MLLGGSFEQQPGCPEASRAALTPARLASLCRGECDHPSDQRRRITRIEVVRIRPGAPGESGSVPRIEDPWKRLDCEGDREGCEVLFSEPDLPSAARDTVSDVRAIEAGLR